MKAGLKEKYIDIILNHPYYSGDENTEFIFQCRADHVSTYECEFRDYERMLTVTFELNIIFTDDCETQFNIEKLTDLLNKDISFFSVRQFDSEDRDQVGMPEELFTYAPMLGVKPELN